MFVGIISCILYYCNFYSIFRHHGIKDFDIETDVKLLKHQKNEYKMKVGPHEATVICKNKREGKQRAAQAILHHLHPHLNSWGALLKLYGRGSCKTPKEKKVLSD